VGLIGTIFQILLPSSKNAADMLTHNGLVKGEDDWEEVA